MAPAAEWLTPDEFGRVGLSDRLVRELAYNPDGRHGFGNDFLASVAVQVRVSSLREGSAARRALSEIGRLVRYGPGSDMWQVSGRGGLVMGVHGPDYSVVFPLDPFTGLILVCSRDMGEHCVEIYDDGPDAYQQIMGFCEAVVLCMWMRRQEIAWGMREPDPHPLWLPGEPLDVDPPVPGLPAPDSPG